jgi:hypothetical protein
MMNFRKFGLASSIFMGIFFTHTVQANDNNIEVTPMQQVTPQELAAIYVISEVCPSLVSDQKKFNSGFEQLIQEYLPNEKEPVEALNKMAKTSDFKAILEEARADAKNAGTEKNQAICEELVTYHK